MCGEWFRGHINLQEMSLRKTDSFSMCKYFLFFSFVLSNERAGSGLAYATNAHYAHAILILICDNDLSSLSFELSAWCGENMLINSISLLYSNFFAHFSLLLRSARQEKFVAIFFLLLSNNDKINEKSIRA